MSYPHALRILVVDDHLDSLGVCVRLLALEGYAPIPATSVRERSAAASREPFDLLLSDIQVGSESALDLMRELKQKYGIKAIAFSGYCGDDDHEEALRAGFDAVIDKPLQWPRLLHVIREVAEGEAGAY